MRIVAEGRPTRTTTELVVTAGTLYLSAVYDRSRGERDGKPETELLSIQEQATPFGSC